METILTIAAIAFTVQYINYQIEKKDKSLQGFIEYLKEKFYYKKKD